MTYIYFCSNCKQTTTVAKPMQDSSRMEHCKLCKDELNRVWEVPSIKTNDGIKK